MKLVFIMNLIDVNSFVPEMNNSGIFKYLNSDAHNLHLQTYWEANVYSTFLFSLRARL